MRVLRSSIYVSPYNAITTVVRDSDVIDTLESIAWGSRQQGALDVHDIFNVRKGSLRVASLAAIERIDHLREGHMALLFHWTLAQFQSLNVGGTLIMNKPAPLPAQDICYVFDQLRQEDGYRNFHLHAFAKDGTPVQLVKGEVR